MSKKYFKRYLEGNEYKLKELISGDKISLSDEIEVHLELYVPGSAYNLFVKDPKIASFDYTPKAHKFVREIKEAQKEIDTWQRNNRK